MVSFPVRASDFSLKCLDQTWCSLVTYPIGPGGSSSIIEWLEHESYQSPHSNTVVMRGIISPLPYMHSRGAQGQLYFTVYIHCDFVADVMCVIFINFRFVSSGT
jgi:hypothetical protein